MAFGKELDELKARFSSVPYGLDAVNIGSGPSYCDFDWSAVPGIAGYNLAVAPEDFRYDARVMMRYGKHLKRNGVVAVVVCPLSFGENAYLYEDSFSERYVPILPGEAVDLPRWKYGLYHACPGVLKIKRALSSLVPGIVQRLRGLSEETVPANPIAGLVDGWIADNKYLRNLTDESQAEFYLDVFREKTKDLKAVIANCRRQGLRPVIVLPPMSGELRKNISDGFIRRFVYDNLHQATEDDVPILDYTDDARFRDESYYTNGLLLTPPVRKVFTRSVWEDIQRLPPRWQTGENGKMERTNEGYRLTNGLTLPWIAFGTGVVWRYSRNKPLFLRTYLWMALSSLKHMKLGRELEGNLFCKKILKEAYGAGFRMFDTGRIYGYSERYIGKTVAHSPGVALVTKCSAMDVERGCSPDTVAGNLDFSLKNLGVDSVDVYLLHWPEGDWLEHYRQIVELHKEGKCRAFGACNMKIEHLRAVEKAGLPLPMLVQTELHPFNAKIELREYCRERGILLMAHTPTARGAKTVEEAGGYLHTLAEKYRKTTVQIILRWHYQNGIIPVVNTFDKAHMRENLDVFDFVLTEEEMKGIDALDRGMVLLDSNGIDDPNYIYNL